MDVRILTDVMARVTEVVSAVTHQDSLYAPRHMVQELDFLQKRLFLIKCLIAIQFPSWLRDCLLWYL